jgi:DNA polymerase-3 subunit alpha
LEKEAKKVSFHFKLKNVEKEFIRSLNELLNQHEGDCKVDFVVYDDDITIEALSRNTKIKMSKELLDDLTEKEIVCKLNKIYLNKIN